MKILYYVLFGFFGLLGGWFVLSSLLGRFSLWNASQLYSKIVLCVAAVIAIVLLYRAYQSGEIEGRWGMGTLWVVAAVVAFQVILLVGAFALRGRTG